MKTDLPILEQRRIEAAIIGKLYAEMVERVGEKVAREVVRAAIVKDAVEAGAAYAEASGARGLEAFHALLPQWTAGGALEIEMIAEAPEEVTYDVVRCRYAEMYREMGLGEIGHLLSCNRDGTFCQGFDPAIELTRTQTIMQGASHCDFRYRMTGASRR